MNRLAIEHSGNIITSFDASTRTLSLPASLNEMFELPPVLNNMPYEQIALGRVSPETADSYIELFESIVRGSEAGTAVFQQNSKIGWRWLEAQYSTVFSNDREPMSAVITFSDITQRLEKEMVYSKWQQSLTERPEESYTLFRCNLSRGIYHDSREGRLLKVEFDDTGMTFSELTHRYAEQFVYEEDRERYEDFLNPHFMLAEYYRRHRSDMMEFRELRPDGEPRWLRLSVDLVEYPNSKDIEAYLMYEDIDEQKRAELLTLERSETDPLTGVLNRAAFISRLEKVLHEAGRGEKHALFMLDVDEFKHINDSFGHGVGDQVLVELTAKLGSYLEGDDLLGRVGGDEFFVLKRNVSGREEAEALAKRIQGTKLAAQIVGAAITTSIGIAMIPRDGKDFDTLYKKVDKALYRAKEHGKKGYMFVGR